MRLMQKSSCFKFFSILSFLTTCLAREFVDDRGVSFTWPDDSSQPTIVVNANGALGLFHLGMTNQQILGVWDKWFVRGSDIDVNSDNPTSRFAADPDKRELDFLLSVKNLSPSCFEDPSGCFKEMDATLLAELNPDFVVYIHHSPFPEITDKVVQTTGKQPIYIDSTYENTAGCRSDSGFEMNETNCFARSVIDIIERTQLLADFLGVPRTEKVRQERQRMCEAATEFSKMAEALHQRGVRCAGVTVRSGNGGSVNMINLNKIPWLRTFEELGLPLVHPALNQGTDYFKTYTLDEWFPKCNSQGTNQCKDLTPVMPIDCWLLDSRSFAEVEENMNELLTFLPIEAIEKSQYSSLLINDGGLSYTNAADVFTEIINDLKGTEALYDTTSCTSVDVTSNDHTSAAYGGLEGGQYACYNKGSLQQGYLTCPEGDYVATGDYSLSAASSQWTDSTFTNGNGGSSGAVSKKEAVLITSATALTSVLILAYVY